MCSFFPNSRWECTNICLLIVTKAAVEQHFPQHKHSCNSLQLLIGYLKWVFDSLNASCELDYPGCPYGGLAPTQIYVNTSQRGTGSSLCPLPHAKNTFYLTYANTRMGFPFLCPYSKHLTDSMESWNERYKTEWLKIDSYFSQFSSCGVVALCWSTC